MRSSTSTRLGVGHWVLPFAIVVLLVSPFALAQQGASGPIVKENATVQIAEHTYLIPDGNVGLVPNVGIIVGGRATLVIDPGMGRRNGETVAHEVATLSKNTELYVASTHFHPEHTTGYLAFPTAKYINSKIQDDEFSESAAEVMKMFSTRSTVMADLLKDVTQRRADISFDRHYMLDLGGVRVQMLVVGPTHTKGDTGFFVEPDGVLFAGDVVMNNSFLAASAVSSMKEWLAAFDAFEALRPHTIVPSHGEIGDGSLVGVNRGVMEAIRARARELKAEGVSADEAATMVQTELQAKYPNWRRVNGVAAAARSAYHEAR